MDPTTTALAVSVTTFIVTKLSEGFLKKAGEQAYNKVEELYKTVKAKFQGDSYAEQTLQRLEQKPEDEGRKAALQGVLAEKAEEDKTFAQTLGKLVQQIEQAGGRSVIAHDRGVAIGGDASNNTIVTGDGNTVGSNNVNQSVTATGGSKISGITMTAGGKDSK